MQLRLQLRAIASFGTKLRVCESQTRDPPVFFSKCPPFPWRMPGFGRAPTRPNGDVGYDPAGPPDGHGGWPGIGQWGGGRRCHPGGGMRPPKRHGMRNAPVQKAPVHGFGDGPAPHPGSHKPRYPYHAHNLTESLIIKVTNEASGGGIASGTRTEYARQFLRTK